MCGEATRDGGEQGMAIVIALWFTVVVLGIATAGYLTMGAHRRSNTTAFMAKAQAVQVARSGLTEALSFLRRQTSQPVTQLDPRLDTTASPPVLDTIDPDIGIVREFQISGKQWARYEVWKDWPADPDPVRLAWRNRYRCEDISTARLATSLGAMWRLRSIGYVFNREDASAAFNEAPNSVVSVQILETEVQRLVLNLPGQAAVNVGDGNSCHINTNARIIGGTAGGIYYPAGTGTPTTGPANQQRVTGSPALSTAAAYDDSFEAVFGVGLDDLRAMADLIVTNQSQFPNPVANNALVIVDTGSTMDWDASVPLLGSGIVIVLGNCVMSQDSLSNFSGLLYIDGNFTMRAPAEIRGAVVVTGNLTMQGVPDFATILFDEDVLNELRADFGSYQRANTMMFPR